jgi:flagellar biosynthesis protein FlhA
MPTWDAAEYLFLGLHAVVRRMAPEFVDIDITRRLVDPIEATFPDLVLQTVPKAVSWFELTDVLRRLVAEEIGIGDLKTILEALSPRTPDWGDTVMLTERVRHALSRQITAKFLRGADALPVLLLDPEIETAIGSVIQRTPVGVFLLLAPEMSQDILAAVRASVGSLSNRAAGAPILVSGADVRPFVRKLVSLEFPALHVLSRQDVMPATPIEAIARIHLTRTGERATPTGDGAPA